MSLYISNGVSPNSHKPSLVLFHAFPISAEMWRNELAQAKAAGIAAVAINAPGFGGNKREPRWRLSTFAHTIKTLIDTLGLKNVIVGGLSMGGYATLAFAKLYPGVASGLVLADTQAGADTSEAKAGRKEFADAVVKNGSGEAVKRMLPKLLSGAAQKKSPELVAQVTAWIDESDPLAISDALEALREREDSTPMLGTISVPTLLLCGEADELTPPAKTNIMKEKISSATVVIIPGAGHLSNLEAPNEFWNALKEFFPSVGIQGQ